MHYVYATVSVVNFINIEILLSFVGVHEIFNYLFPACHAYTSDSFSSNTCIEIFLTGIDMLTQNKLKEKNNQRTL